MKCVTITKCSECPHVGHKGGFGSIAYIPVCCKGEKHRTLPYQTYTVNGKECAEPKDKIPYWCPLEDR